MAKAIRKIADRPEQPEEKRERAVRHAADQLSEHQAAVTELFRTLGNLHDSGALGMLNALLEQGEELLDITVNMASRPEYATGLKNGIGLLALLGSLDVRMLGQLTEAVAQASERARKRDSTDTLSVWKLMGALKDPDVSAGLQFALDVLRALGSGVRQSPEPDAAGDAES